MSTGCVRSGRSRGWPGALFARRALRPFADSVAVVLGPAQETHVLLWDDSTAKKTRPPRLATGKRSNRQIHRRANKYLALLRDSARDGRLPGGGRPSTLSRCTEAAVAERFALARQQSRTQVSCSPTISLLAGNGRPIHTLGGGKHTASASLPTPMAARRQTPDPALVVDTRVTSAARSSIRSAAPRLLTLPTVCPARPGAPQPSFGGPS